MPKKNMLANAINQIYFILIALVITPFYLKYLGPEAYGLVGFFTLLQTWLNLLDVGLTPTLARQVAVARGKGDGFDDFHKLLKSFEYIFLVLSLVISVCFIVSSNWLSSNWINAERLRIIDISYCVSLMGCIIGLRWFSGLYRSGINGFEDQIWLSGASVLITTLKYVGSLFVILFVDAGIRAFFEFQLLIGVLELFILRVRFIRLLPPPTFSQKIVQFDWGSIKEIAPFALGIGYTSGIWIFISQIDKLILSSVLTLTDFGYFSIALLISGTINTISVPIILAVQPRMNYLLSRGEEDEMLELYKNATQLVTLATCSVTAVIALYAEPLIFSWTGSQQSATWSKDVLFWYALGNGIMSIAAFQYYLQVAFGNLKLHILGSTLSLVIDVPIIVYISFQYGALGAGMSWFILRFFWMIVWTPIVHKKFAPGIHMRWLLKDVLLVLMAIIVGVCISGFIIDVDSINDRWMIFGFLNLIGIVTLSFGVIGSSFLRRKIYTALRGIN